MLTTCSRFLIFLLAALAALSSSDAGGLRREATCCCLQQPTGRGCGEVMRGGCDESTCDGTCVTGTCGGGGGRVSGALIETASAAPSKQTATNGPANGVAAIRSPRPPLPVERDAAVKATNASGSGAFAAEDIANNASFTPPPASSLSAAMASLAPSLAPGLTAAELAARRAAALAARRAAMLKRAEENLVEAEEDVIKSHGVHVGDALPQNVLITMLHAENTECLQNVTRCDWLILPTSLYGGDVPTAVKSAFGSLPDSETLTISCVVCDDKSQCTRPESMATRLHKKLSNPGEGTRNDLPDLSHDVAAMERRCRYQPPPFDIKLRHLRNQHGGLAGMWGKAPALERVER